MIKKIFTLLTFFLSIAGFAQKSNSSPYSFFGIGDPAALKSVEEIGMGKTGGVLDSPYQLSFTNPASYASLLYTTYVFSGGNRVTKFEDNDISETSSHAGFTYLALGIPVRGNQGIAVGLQLNTSVGYSLLDTEYDVDDVLIETNKFTGSGGTNRFYLGYAYKFPFHLNVGVEAAYIFGGIDNSIRNRRLNVQYATIHKVDSYVRGYEFRAGAFYAYPLKDNVEIKAGASFTFGHELNDKGDESLYSVENNNDVNPVPVKYLYTRDYDATLTYPLKSVISVGVGKINKWFVGADYTFMDAINSDGTLLDEQDVYKYVKSSMISVGGSYTPRFNSISNYLYRITYRTGFYMNKRGLMVNDTQVDDYGISFGVSLPVSLNISNLNLGVELGNRGTNEGNLLKEKYFNFRLSLSLNDKWFRKRTIN